MLELKQDQKKQIPAYHWKPTTCALKYRMALYLILGQYDLLFIEKHIHHYTKHKPVTSLHFIKNEEKFHFWKKNMIKWIPGLPVDVANLIALINTCTCLCLNETSTSWKKKHRLTAEIDTLKKVVLTFSTNWPTFYLCVFNLLIFKSSKLFCKMKEKIQIYTRLQKWIWNSNMITYCKLLWRDEYRP